MTTRRATRHAAAPDGAGPSIGMPRRAGGRTSELENTERRGPVIGMMFIDGPGYHAAEWYHAEPLVVVVDALPPTVNHMYLPNARGGKRLSPEADTFRWLVIQAVNDRAKPATVPEGDLQLSVRLWFGTRHRQDLDNRLKAAQDALALALKFDDTRIRRLIVESAGYAKGKPACEMVLEAFEVPE